MAPRLRTGRVNRAEKEKVSRRDRVAAKSQFLFLQGASLSVCPLGQVEDNCVRVKLGRDVAVNRAGGIVLKLGGDKPIYLRGDVWYYLFYANGRR